MSLGRTMMAWWDNAREASTCNAENGGKKYDSDALGKPESESCIANINDDNNDGDGDDGIYDQASERDQSLVPTHCLINICETVGAAKLVRSLRARMLPIGSLHDEYLH